MKKLQEMQQQMQEIKDRLDSISVQGEAGKGKVKVICTGNKKISDISLDTALMNSGEKEEIQDLLVMAVNNALEKAEKVSESEMQGAAKGLMNMPGLFK